MLKIIVTLFLLLNLISIGALLYSYTLDPPQTITPATTTTPTATIKQIQTYITNNSQYAIVICDATATPNKTLFQGKTLVQGGQHLTPQQLKRIYFTQKAGPKYKGALALVYPTNLTTTTTIYSTTDVIYINSDDQPTPAKISDIIKAGKLLAQTQKTKK